MTALQTIDYETGEIVDDSQALARLDQAWIALSKVRTIPEALDLSNRAAAVQYYLRRSSAELGVQNKAAAVRILSKHKAALMLVEMPKQGPGDHWQEKRDQPDPAIPTLSDLGITKSEASQLRTLAKLDEGEIAEYIKETDKRGKEVTAAGVLQLAKVQERQERQDQVAARGQDASRRADIQIIHDDCLRVIDNLNDGSVALLLTDPPYNVTDNEWDTWETPAAYWEFMRSWLAALRPKMAPDFTAFIFCDATETVNLHNALAATGWPILGQTIWHRPNIAKKRSGSKTFLSAYEPFWHCGTRALFFPDEWSGERFDVQVFVAPQSNHTGDPAYHPTQKPLALFRRLVGVGSQSGELVFDPFCGAGTTATACACDGRRCVTSDLNSGYIDIARGRVAVVEH